MTNPNKKNTKISTPQDIEIIGRLLPHPLIDFLEIEEEEEISWIPGYTTEKSEEETDSFTHVKNMELYDSLEENIAEFARAAVIRFWPILKDFDLRKIVILIEYIEEKSGTILTAYDYSNSNPDIGAYCFYVYKPLFIAYANYINKSIDVLPYKNIWEYGLVHMLDHSEIVKSQSLRYSTLPANNYKHYILRYREAGIANLLDFLDGELDIDYSIFFAKLDFSASCRDIKGKLDYVVETTEELCDEIYESPYFYTIGPWLILDMLRDRLKINDHIQIDEVVMKVRKGHQISEDLTLIILKNALCITNDIFYSNALEYIENF